MTDFQQVTNDLLGRGFTIAELCEKTGAHESTIRALRDGRNREPRYALGVALVDLERRTRRRK